MKKNTRIKHPLAHSLGGVRLDKEALLPSKTALLWRSSKPIDEVEARLREIRGALGEWVSSLGIDKAGFVRRAYLPRFFSVTRPIAPPPLPCKPSLHSTKALRMLSRKENPFMVDRAISHRLAKNLARRGRLFGESIKPSYYEKLDSKNLNGLLRMHIFKLPNKEWVREYQASLRPVICGKFCISPSWHAKEARSMAAKGGLNLLFIDPSLSFGSGHHATSSLCVGFLGELDLKGRQLLDVGCGSGILSLVGARLGAAVYACDTDSFAISQTKQNFSLNGLAYEALWKGSLEALGDSKKALPSKYDFVCANLVGSILIILASRLVACLKEGGVLIVSGILDYQEAKILDRFKALKPVERRQVDEWVSIKFTNEVI